MTSNQAVQSKEELLDIIDGEMGDLALELDLCTDDRLWRSLRLISITFGSIAEGHLRVLLTLSGINLTEEEDFRAASVITTAFAVEGALEIRDLLRGLRTLRAESVGSVGRCHWLPWQDQD